MKPNNFFFTLILIASCNTSNIKVEEKQLEGKWNFTRTLRNDKETQTTNSAFIVFHPDKSVTSNLFQVEENKTFTLHENKIKINGGESYEWTITEFAGDSMKLEGKMYSFDMQMYLKKE
ncbi:MAG: hypothetical protein RLZZ546_2017 [Bacteroidota bacterium]|jgi:hypothetical protein